MKDVYDTLLERGFVAQVTDAEQIKELVGHDRITCYVGFDPTAASLHIGSLVPIMALMHIQQHGHRPVILIGGGTGLIGDPSGKTEMRQLLTHEQIDSNARSLQRQLSRYIDFQDEKALLLNNADWLTKLNYIEFLRDIGRHFSVNKMLAAESYKQRLEKGLNLIEFNYMLLQAYDFLYLFKSADCRLQLGGNDQWGNIVAGIDLIRRVTGKTAYGITFPLLITARGHKMGKTEKGAIWLDASLTTPYNYYQYWINTDDCDVEKFLALFTFLPLEEIRKVGQLADQELNMAKTVLAFEATRITHGEEAAVASWMASAKAFNTKPVDITLFPSCPIPRSLTPSDFDGLRFLNKTPEELEKGIPAFELFYEAGVCASKSEARKVISQGGGYVNDRQLCKFDDKITINEVNERGEIVLRKGKKNYFIVSIKDEK